jgi:hypothetical protein
MLLGLTDSVVSNWGTVWWIIGIFVGVCLPAVYLVGIWKRSLRFRVWGATTVLVVASLFAASWHYFGWETVYCDTGWTVWRHRYFGRVTVLAYETNYDGVADSKCYYRFSDPWVSEGDHWRHYVVCKEDNNFDGRWDTWWTPTDQVEGGERSILFEADTDLDGRPDYRTVWQQTEPFDDFDEYEIVEKLRGF